MIYHSGCAIVVYVCVATLCSDRKKVSPNKSRKNRSIDFLGELHYY